MACSKIRWTNIHLKFHVIKNLVYSIKQSKYINDDLFLLRIDKIKITLDKNKSNLTDLPFYFCKKILLILILKIKKKNI